MSVVRIFEILAIAPGTEMPAQQFFMRRLLLAGTIAFVLLLIALTFSDRRNPGGSESSSSKPGLELSPGPLASTRHREFIGSDACLSCHPSQHDSYLHSAHSRAMSRVIPENEPADAMFAHPVSGRAYTTERRDGKIWHTEFMDGAATNAARMDDEPGSPQASYELAYLVGSGRHSRTYLTEQDGFLIESPLTWYHSSGQWAMSPGYDHAEHEGFERAADTGCLICHVGQMESIGNSSSRLKILEPAIGCERCHGAGKEHVDKWQGLDLLSARSRSEESDPTIVHPGKLSRDLAEAICAQCHLRGDATVSLAGKLLTDFEPGKPLKSVRIDYRLETDDDSMKVVGHVDQMRESRCFQQSPTLTCTTCHDMHSDRPAISSSVEFYRQKCINCHASEACHVAPAERFRIAPGDNCVQCHMPQVATDIPHIAFTHHRIGIHEPDNSQAATRKTAGQLRPFDETLSLSPNESDRNLGLAYIELADKQTDSNFAQIYRSRSKEMLAKVATTSSVDGDVLAALARFSWEEGRPKTAERLAVRAMENPLLSDRALMNCLMVAGDSLLQLRRSESAIPHFEKLVSLRRRSQDWLLLGIARFQNGQTEPGIQAVQHAIEIQPFRADIHLTLSDMFSSLGRTADSVKHRQIATKLEAGR